MAQPSLKRVWLVFGGGVIAAAVLLGTLWGWLHKDDPRFVNYSVALVPVILSILIAFVPDLRKAHMAWRIAIVGIGMLWSVLLWRQQVISDQQQSDALMHVVETANKHTDQTVAKANDHTDTEVGMVRDDLKANRTRSDEQNSALKQDVGTLASLIAKQDADLTASMNKVGRPDPPERPRFIFSLWGDGMFDAATNPLLNYAIRPDKDGVFVVDYTFVNVSSVAASKIDLWVHICKACEFASEPEGFDKPAGIEEGTRTRPFPVTINAGTAFAKSTLRIKTKEQLPFFDIGFHYSCETCGGASKIQTLTVTVLR